MDWAERGDFTYSRIAFMSMLAADTDDANAVAVIWCISLAV